MQQEIFAPLGLVDTGFVVPPAQHHRIAEPFEKDPDGGVTLRVQNVSPGPDEEPNWLPAPTGRFQIYLRLYWPKPAALDGTWQPPKLTCGPTSC